MGQMLDRESGLDFFDARMFASAFGRFTSPDPGNAGADVHNPRTWNGYAYAGNSPLVNVDPSGKCFFCTVFGFALAPFTGLQSFWLAAIGIAAETGPLLGRTLSH